MNENLRFQVTGAGPAKSFDWDFGDASAASGVSGDLAFHLYEKPGDYTVTVKIGGEAGDQVTVTTKVQVLPPQIQASIAMTVDPTVPLLPGARVRFAADVVRPSSWDTPVVVPPALRYRWAFSDGITADTATVARAFEAAGAIDAELTVTDKYGRVVSVKKTLTMSGTVRPTMLQTNLGGNGSMNYGPLTLLGTPAGMVRDKAGNVFVMDRENLVIRKIAPDGQVSDFAGASGLPGPGGLVDGVGDQARFYNPGLSMSIDPSDTLYVIDSQQLRTVSPAGEVRTTDRAALAAASDSGVLPWFDLTDVEMGPDGALYLADGPRLLRLQDGRVTVVAGDRSRAERAWVDGPGTVARFGHLNALAVRPDGQILALDSCYGVRKIAPDGTVSTMVRYAEPWQTLDIYGNCSWNSGTSIDRMSDGKLLMVWRGDLRVIDAQDNVRTVATSLWGAGQVVQIDASTAWISRPGSHVIEWVSLTNGTHSVKVGRDASSNDAVTPFPTSLSAGVQPYDAPALDADGTLLFAYEGSIWRFFPVDPGTLPAVRASTEALRDGLSGDARIGQAGKMVSDASGNLYFVDSSRILRRRSAQDGSIRTLAGSRDYGNLDGLGVAAQFTYISGLAVSASGDTVYVVDDFGRLKRIVVATGEVRTIREKVGRSSLAMTSSGQLLWIQDGALVRLEADGSTSVLAGSTDLNAARTRRVGPYAQILVLPTGQILLLDSLPSQINQTGLRVLRRVEADGTLTDIVQDAPMQLKMYRDRDPLEIPFGMQYAVVRKDGSLLVWAGQPHSWWTLDGAGLAH